MTWERYTIKTLDDNRTYKFDKIIFSISILLLLIVFFIIVYLIGGLSAEKNIYVKCDIETGQSYCKNPLYREYKYCNNLWVGACEQEYLSLGFTYGTPPPIYLRYFNQSVFAIIALAFFINHFVHNKNFHKRGV